MPSRTLSILAVPALVAGLTLIDADRPLAGESSVAEATRGAPAVQAPAFTRCGVADLSPEEAERVEADVASRLRRAGLEDASEVSIVIPTAFHVIYEGDTVAEGNIPDSMILEQLDVLNAAYVGCRVSFTLETITRTYEPRWYHMDPGSAAEAEAKAALGLDPTQVFNVYLAELGSGLLGWATFPWLLETEPELDGVVILNASLPGGSADPYNEGDTLVHEGGHWLGLYHTFQGGCLSPGDYVYDTPAERRPAYGCPETRDSCFRQGLDPVNNYMDYVDDACMDEFTAMQCVRIARSVAAYRPALITR